MWQDADNKDELSNSEVTRLTTQLISAYSSRNNLGPDDLLKLIDLVRNKLSTSASMTQPVALEAPTIDANPRLIRDVNNPAVDPKKSVFKDYIVCLEDGERMKMLKRYLKTNYDLTPEEYKARWGLPADYPMICKSLSDARAETAKRVRPSDAKKRKTDAPAKPAKTVAVSE